MIFWVIATNLFKICSISAFYNETEALGVGDAVAEVEALGDTFGLTAAEVVGETTGETLVFGDGDLVRVGDGEAVVVPFW